MSDPTTPPESYEVVVLRGVIERLQAELIKATDLIRAVQAELLAGGSLARLRAIVGLTPKESPTNAERS